MRFLLDTNICIYVLKKRPPEVLERFRNYGPEAVAISVITALELWHGAAKSQHPEKTQAKLDLFLAPIRTLSFREDAGREAAQIRAYLDQQGTPIGDLDSLIAAQALASDLVLVTNNLREFQRVPGLRTENWVAP